MIKSEQIPKAARAAAEEAFMKGSWDFDEILAAALNAWEGAHPMMIINGTPVDIVLPLQETK